MEISDNINPFCLLMKELIIIGYISFIGFIVLILKLYINKLLFYFISIIIIIIKLFFIYLIIINLIIIIIIIIN